MSLLKMKWFQARRARRISKIFLSLPDFDGVSLIDIGAAGGLEPRWRQVAQHTKYVGFEPDERAHKLLANQHSICKEYAIHPFAIWSSAGEIEINLARKPQVSSAFAPNASLLDKFLDSSRFDRVNSATVPTKTLDALSVSSPDFIKLDIQGAELEALLGAESTLSSCVGIELEVEFSEIYSGQPLFGEVSRFLTNSGFEFYDFLNLCRWERDSFSGIGQLVFGDALFLRTPENFLASNPSIQKISSYLSILVLYNRFDLIEITKHNLMYSHGIHFQKFFKSASKLRNHFNNLNKLLRVVNSIIYSISPTFKFYLNY